MLKIHPQYIKDAKGQKSLVVLTSKEFEKLMEKLEDAEDIKLYDEAKNEDDGSRISLSDYLKERAIKNG